MDQLQTFISTASSRLPVILAAAGVIGLVFITPKVLEAYMVYKIPTIGKELGNEEKRRVAYLRGARKLYNEGYQKFKNGVFQITTSRDAKIIVLSPKFLPELNKLPDTSVSMEAAVDEAMDTKYTKIETHVPIIPHTITGKLTPALVRLNPTIAEEVQLALTSELPKCDDWTEVNIQHQLTRIVAKVSGRIFVGPDLARSEQYLDAAINYTLEVMSAHGAVQKLRPWMRPYFAGALPEVKRLDKRIKEAEEFFAPVAELRKAAVQAGDIEKPDDMLQWLIEGQSKYTDKNSQSLARVQLGLSFAAIHTTTLTATNAFYNIAAMPELVPEFREEIRTALADNGGVFTSLALQSMKKIDSFLKESLRVNPATMAAFQRKVLKTITLSNGQMLPAGVTIEVPAVSVSSDPQIFADPEKFDALRFYRLRQEAKEVGAVEKAALNQFVSVSQESLTFGYGRHACPGRFFAANEIKMIFANTLMKYDMELVDGSTQRYPNIEFAHMSIPDSSKTILIRAIEV